MILIGNICKPDAGLKKPAIIGEEDRPFSLDQAESGNCGNSSIQDIPTLMKLNEQKHSHRVDDFKNIVGGILLGVCLLIIVAFAIGDAIFYNKYFVRTGKTL